MTGTWLQWNIFARRTFWDHLSIVGDVLRFYPHFSTFLTHETSRALSFPCHLPRAPSMCLQITGLILAYVALTCIILFAHALVWFLTAVPRLLITFLWLIRLWLTRPPLVLYTFPIWYASWSPPTSQVHHVSPLSEALCFFPWSRTTVPDNQTRQIFLSVCFCS